MPMVKQEVAVLSYGIFNQPFSIEQYSEFKLSKTHGKV